MPSHLLRTPSFDLSWIPERGLFRLDSPGRFIEAGPGIEFIGRRRTTISSPDVTAARVSEESVRDVHGEANELQIHYQEILGLALSLHIRLYENRPFVLLRLTVTNVGTTAVGLRRLFVKTPPRGIRTVAPPSGSYVNGWQSWSPAGFLPIGAKPWVPSLPERWLEGPLIQNGWTPWSRRPERRWSETMGAVVTPREALVGGIVSTADQFGQVMTDVNVEECAIVMQTQLDGIMLDIGGSQHSEWFYLEWVPLPNLDPFAQYAHAVARQMRVKPRSSPPTGWCSWYVYGAGVEESDVVENLASAALLADSVPLGVLQLDDGYQTAWGDWTTRNERFPHPLSWLADRIRGSGFEPGIWVAPLVAERGSQLARQHPEWLLKRHGRPVKAGLVSSFFGRALDPTHPGVLDLVRETVRTMVEDWGYAYLKLDYLYAGALRGRRHDPQTTRAQALRGALEAIRGAAGPETYLLGCGAPLGPAIGLMDAMRIGPDTAGEWSPEVRGIRWLVAGNPTLPSLRNSLRSVTTRAWMHGRWWVNDPDVMLMRERTSLTPDEVVAQATLIGLSGGPAFLSDDLDAVSPERRAVSAALMPQLLDGVDFADLLTSAEPELAIVPVARAWGRWWILALFNWTEEPVERELPEALDLDERKAYHLVDFWERRYLRLPPGALRPVLHLAPHGVALLGIREEKTYPHLVSSTFHISQGAEVTRFEAGEDSVSLDLALGRSAKGAVWLSLPARPTYAAYNREVLPEEHIRAVAAGVWAVGLEVRETGSLDVTWTEDGCRRLAGA